MQTSNIPQKYDMPFGANAGVGQIRPIPTASQIGLQLGAASLNDGYPPACFVPIAAGGSWPFGQDTQRMFNWESQWSQWFSAGGPAIYDAAWQVTIGGYPRHAIVRDVSGDPQWRSTTENNMTAPSFTAATWQKYPIQDAMILFAACC
jgi:hypothetical protein